MKKILLAIALSFQTLLAAEPHLSCEKIWGQITWEGMEFHRYKLRAENFPAQQKYVLIVRSFDGTETETFTYHSNKKGHLILQPVENVGGDLYAICPAKRGERLTFLMRSGESAYATDVIPFPLEMKSKKGIKISLELQGEKGEKFLLWAQGLQPNEHIQLQCNIGEQTLQLEAPPATPLGDLVMYIDLPADQDGGAAKLILKRKQEEITFPFEWGTPAMKVVGACCFELK